MYCTSGLCYGGWCGCICSLVDGEALRLAIKIPPSLYVESSSTLIRWTLIVGEWSCVMWGNHATCSCCRPFWGGEVFLWTSKHDLWKTMKNYHSHCNCSARVGDTFSHYPWVLLFFSFSSWIVARMQLWQTFLHFAGTNQRIARLGQEASKPEVEGKCCVFYTRE